MVNKTIDRVSVLFLLLLGVLPQLSLLCQTLELGVHPRLWLWIAGAALCLWVCACFRRGLLLGMPASALLLYEAYRFFDAVPITEMDDLIDKFSGAYFRSYIAPDASYTYLNAVEDHSFVLLLIAFLLLAYLASGLTARSGRRFLCFLGTVPVVGACLSVNGFAPTAPVVAVLLFWALILVSGDYRENGASGRLAFFYSVPVLLLLCAVLSFNRPEDYRLEERDSAVARELERLGDWLMERLEPAEGEAPFTIPQTIEASPEAIPDTADTMLWESEGGGMDLTQNYTPQMLETLFLRVNADSTGLLYLRGTSYGDYTGTGWDPAAAAPLSSLGLTAEAVEAVGERRQLSLQSVTPLRYAMLPYYSALTGDGDASVPSSLQSSRLRYTVYAGDFDALAADRVSEQQYREFAHAAYTRLPQETRTVMLNLAAEAGIDIHSPTLIDDVANYIRGAGVYDLETEPYPSTDYAVWFLTQAHRGYCVHFATAATAMYRALGVPARITEGFLLRTEAGRFTDVRGENAHAWVEIYRDGVGWLPVEVTGQSGLNPQVEDTEEEAVTEAPVEEPEETSAPQPVPAAPSPTAESLPVGIMQPQAREESRAQQAAFPWFSLGAVLLLAAALLLWPLLQRRIWRRRLSDPDANKAVLAAYRRAEALSPLLGSVPDAIRICAEKAFFSAQGANTEESERCRQLLEETLRERLSRLSPLKRLFWQYVYGLF